MSPDPPRAEAYSDPITPCAWLRPFRDDLDHHDLIIPKRPQRRLVEIYLPEIAIFPSRGSCQPLAPAIHVRGTSGGGGNVPRAGSLKSEERHDGASRSLRTTGGGPGSAREDSDRPYMIAQWYRNALSALPPRRLEKISAWSERHQCKIARDRHVT